MEHLFSVMVLKLCLPLGLPVFAGQLWELDGRRAGPVCHGPTSRDSLLADSARVVREFVSRWAWVWASGCRCRH